MSSFLGIAKEIQNAWQWHHKNGFLAKYEKLRCERFAHRFSYLAKFFDYVTKGWDQLADKLDVRLQGQS